ncbi:MAG: efflux RND transporter periplasmic adaptor subunit [Acidobacteriota bacterium]
MSRVRAGLWAIGLSVLSAGALVWRWDAAPMETEVETAFTGRRTLERTVLATGVIRPAVGAEIEVGSRVSGRVVDLPVRVGDRVQAGDLLARLDSKELDAGVEQAKADLELARAELAQAQSAAARQRRLAAQEVLPAAALDVAERDLAVAVARVESRAARLRAAEINRGYSRITAPIHGVIAEVSTRRGETVAASFAAPTFVTIINLERLEVRAFVDETDIGRVFVGQSATFTVDTYSEVEIPATVTAIRPKAELQGNVVNYVVLLAYEATEGVQLRPEMTAHLRLELERRENVLIAPRRSVHRRDGRTYVNVRRDGAWAEQEVQSGWRTDGVVEILGGLEDGDVLRLHPE